MNITAMARGGNRMKIRMICQGGPWFLMMADEDGACVTGGGAV
jgi:hypothetical protein